MSGTVTSLKPSGRKCERDTADNLDSSDCDNEITSEFVAAQLYMQAAEARQQAMTGLTFVGKTISVHESDFMFKDFENSKHKSDEQLKPR